MFFFVVFSHYQAALVQLIKMCRGIGDPLVAAYVRCYICRVKTFELLKIKEFSLYLKVTIDIDFKYRDPIEIAFTDFCNSCHQIGTEYVKNLYTSQKLTTSVYLSLYSPALDWIVQCLLHKLDEKKIEKIINKTRSGLNLPRCVKKRYFNLFEFVFLLISGGVVLNALLNTLPPTNVRSKVQQYITMISECDEQYFPKVKKKEVEYYLKLSILFIKEYTLSFSWSFSSIITTSINTIGSPNTK